MSASAETECPPAEHLLELAGGLLSDDAQARVESHIDQCPMCRGALSSLARSDQVANKSFGRYELETVIGSGGMGVVYRAWDPQLAREVAIKLVRQAGHSDALRKRLVHEAQSLARLSHPNVCHVYDVGTEGDEVWVAMELIDGTTLRQWVQQAQPSREQLLAVLLDAAEGIAAAHAAGLIHRDIKPENVLVTKTGRPIVMDFGLARVDLPVDPQASTMSGDPLLTATGAIVGTPAYLAPEQLTGDTLDARVDQFAWAVMAWELLTGVRPFPIIAAIRLDAIRAGLTPPASLPKPIANALVKAMSLAPRDRFDSIRTLIDTLRVKPAAKRSRVPLVIGASAVLAVGATVGIWQLTRADDRTTPAAAPAIPDAASIGSASEPPATVITPAPDALVIAPAPHESEIPRVVEARSNRPEKAAPPSAKAAPGVAPKANVAPEKEAPTSPVPGTPSATLAEPPPSTPATTQPPLRPLNNPKFSVARAYSSMVHFCRIPVDVKNPDPRLGKYGVVDWGPITKKETVIAKHGDREFYSTMHEVRGHRETYQFDGIGAGDALGKFDYPVGTLVALCRDPNRPEKSEIFERPPPWDKGEDLIVAGFPISAPPIVDQLKSLAPLHVTDLELQVSGSRGSYKMKQASHYLVQAKIGPADGKRFDMNDWWLEIGAKAKNADLVATGKRLWLVIEAPQYETGVEGEKPKLVAKAVMVFDEIFPR